MRRIRGPRSASETERRIFVTCTVDPGGTGQRLMPSNVLRSISRGTSISVAARARVRGVTATVGGEDVSGPSSRPSLESYIPHGVGRLTVADHGGRFWFRLTIAKGSGWWVVLVALMMSVEQ